MKNNLRVLLNGFVKENPVFVLLLGTCPTLATTSSASNGFAMGMATTCVLCGSNLVISCIANIVPKKIRIPVYIVVIATFVSSVDMLMKAYAPPALYSALGIFIPLIVVNCIVLGRAEAFASKHGPLRSIFDGLGMGLGFTLALCVIATVREVLGEASFAGIAIPFLESFKIGFMTKAPGGMVVYGLLIALVSALTLGKGPKKKEFSCTGCPGAKFCASASACVEKKEEV